ncbi:MAG: hypothetical protein FWG62_06055 [Proteobacteria bacterium]|nr:hypothetical protein [Pseudomonadota bacterium]
MISSALVDESAAFAAGHDHDGEVVSGGWCRRCRTFHCLPLAPARAEALALMSLLQRHGRIDWQLEPAMADPRCSTEPLFGSAGGKMFGVLCCRDGEGRREVLRAFSGQFNGLWQADGWVEPLFEVAGLEALIREPEKTIQDLGAKMALLLKQSDDYQRLHQERRALSRQLMRAVHELYRLRNFRGETLPLTEAFLGPGAPPSGTGDCCGPKLIQHAIRHGLRPESMAEFYWGAANASNTKIHGGLYPACAAKCGKILGFQLCGLQ